MVIYKHFLNINTIQSGFNAILKILVFQKLQKWLLENYAEIDNKSNDQVLQAGFIKVIKYCFKPKYSVSNAIEDIIEAYESNKIDDSEKSYTVKWMKKLGLNI